jgi:hypothetical protein
MLSPLVNNGLREEGHEERGRLVAHGIRSELGVLSVCCLSGGPPSRLAALLALLRPVADELVVAVDERVDLARLGRVAELADVLVTYPFADPVERPFAWLHSLCGGEWIFRIDDDEVPSRALLEALRTPDEQLTHLWVPRRWLWDEHTWLTDDPWVSDWQLRLVRPGAARFPGRMHMPVQAEGPHAYLEAPLYHLDLVVNDEAHRATKASHYEHARPGLRLGGLPLNAAYYLPELRDSLTVTPVPPEDVRLVQLVLEAPDAIPGAQPRARLATREEIDAHWAEAPLADEDYRATIELWGVPSPIVGEVREANVRVTNLGAAVWPEGVHGLPEIRLSYRWRGLEHVDEQLRTALPHDVPPGESALVPMTFRAPDQPGTFELVVDLVHERRRWFGVEERAEVVVRPRRQAVVLVGQPPGEEAFDRRVEELLGRIDASLEPVLIGPKEDWLRDRFGTKAHATPPDHADKVFIVPAGQRRERLRLQQIARKLEPREHHVVDAMKHVARAIAALVLGAGLGPDRLG